VIKAVIFDMDGVIVDSEPLHYEAHNLLLKEYGHSLTEEDQRKYTGTSGFKVYEDLKKRFNLPHEVHELVKKKRDLFLSIAEKVQMMPHAAELIHLLKRSDYKLAVASGGVVAYINLFLKKFGVNDCFAAIVSIDDVKNAKPHPESYLEAARRLGVKPNECVAIEDSDKGLESAKQAGMKVIAVPNFYTKHHDLSKADIIVSNLGEVTLETIKNMG
jgi:HAD superfamily hydrolase (TIGR01509 family)